MRLFFTANISGVNRVHGDSSAALVPIKDAPVKWWMILTGGGYKTSYNNAVMDMMYALDER